MLSSQNFAVILCVFAAFCFLLALKYRSKREDYPYELQDSILTKTELKFYRELVECVPPGVLVFCKPRIADVLKVQSLGSDTQRWQRAFNKINAKHFDFVLCEEEGLSYLCAIELNDSSHELPQRQQRDYFVSKACQAAGLPLLMLPTEKDYSHRQLIRKIDSVLG